MKRIHLAMCIHALAFLAFLALIARAGHWFDF
jgi:hypothetical protein